MKAKLLYWLYGLAVVGALSAAEYRGWTWARRAEVLNVPKSVRDNPGAYRSHYAGSPRYLRGK